MGPSDSLDDYVEYNYHGNGSRKRLLIFFLPGNPGVVEYYRNFLSDLHKDLTNGSTKGGSVVESSASKDSFHERISHIATYGHSHPGFELHKAYTSIPGPPFNLDQQIENAKRRLKETVRRCNDGVDDKNAEPLKVVLIGHSVGSYMLMELVEWWQREVAEKIENKGVHEASGRFDLVGGVCLFPTVVDLVQSPRGKFMRWVLATPGLQWAAWLLASILSLFISPIRVWNWPAALTPCDDPAPENSRITQSFIESPSGVRQTIILAADEMKQIRKDKWHPSHVWGAHDPAIEATKTSIKASPVVPRTKLYFYWGRDDYWVDNTSRNKLIELRARRADDKVPTLKGKPTMVIDRHDMDHCFSLEREHARIVAEQVAEWVRELGNGF